MGDRPKEGREESAQPEALRQVRQSVAQLEGHIATLLKNSLEARAEAQRNAALTRTDVEDLRDQVKRLQDTSLGDCLLRIAEERISREDAFKQASLRVESVESGLGSVSRSIERITVQLSQELPNCVRATEAVRHGLDELWRSLGEDRRPSVSGSVKELCSRRCPSWSPPSQMRTTKTGLTQGGQMLYTAAPDGLQPLRGFANGKHPEEVRTDTATYLRKIDRDLPEPERPASPVLSQALGSFGTASTTSLATAAQAPVQRSVSVPALPRDQKARSLSVPAVPQDQTAWQLAGVVPTAQSLTVPSAHQRPSARAVSPGTTTPQSPPRPALAEPLWGGIPSIRRGPKQPARLACVGRRNVVPCR